MIKIDKNGVVEILNWEKKTRTQSICRRKSSKIKGK